MKTIPQHAFIDFVAKMQTFAGWHEQRAVNRNFLFYSLWFALQRHGRLRKSQYQQLQSATQAWHERIYLALESVSLLLSKHEQTQASDLLKEEMHFAEAVEQYLLAQALMRVQLLPRTSLQQLSDACHNVVGYYRFMQATMSEEDQATIITLLCATFSDLSEAETRSEWLSALNAAKLISTSVEQLPLEEL